MAEERKHIGRAIAHLGFIAEKLGDLHGPATVVNELLQNADDAPNATHVRFTVTDEGLEVWNDGEFARCDDPLDDDCAWLRDRGNRCDFHSFRLVASRDKQRRDETTGAFGIGFTSVYQLTDHPVLISNGEHWTMDESAPELERIALGDFPTGHVGTTFSLPWARAATDLRRELQQEPLDDAYVNGFPAVLTEAIPSALLFLKKVEHVEVVAGPSTVVFTRQDEGDVRTISSSDGAVRRALLVRGDFDAVAARLKSDHSVISSKRSASLTVAVPLEEDAPPGRLYATLPSEQLTGLPVSIDATFFPATDRKRIRFDDDAVSHWNRAAIDAAARVIAANVERIAEALGDRAFVGFLRRSKELAQTPRSTRDRFDAIWQQLVAVLPDAAVVPVVGVSHKVSLETARFWAEDAELDAADLLARHRLHLIAPEVKGEWWSLRGGSVSVHRLSLKEVLERWLSVAFPPHRAATPMQPSDGMERIWPLVSALITEVHGGEVIAALRQCALVPGLDGQLHSLVSARRFDKASLKVRRSLGLFVPAVDESALESAPRLLGLTVPFTLDDLVPALEVLAEEDVALSGDQLAEALRWCSGRWSAEGSQELGAEILAVPVVESVHGRVSLSELSLPGTFTDPLELAGVLALPRLEDLRPFLRQLGMRELTFSVYCVDHVAPAIEAGEVAATQVGGFVELLAEHHNSVWKDDSVRSVLRELELVLCDDGHRRLGRDVYLDLEVRAVVGEGVAVAAPIAGVHPGTSRTVLEWLGAHELPTPEDVETRLAWLKAGPRGRAGAATAILEFAQRLLDEDPERLNARYGSLRTEPWMPVKGRAKGAVPCTLYDEARSYLFASQADFVDLSVTLQRQYVAILRWLGVGSEPTARLVVDHLLHQAGRNEPVNKEVYRWLSERADSPELGDLVGTACIHIVSGDRYVRPDQVFWGSHGLGRFRFQLPHEMSSLQGLFDRLGVAEQPTGREAADVLIELALERGGEEGPIHADDQKVVHECWRIISQDLLAGTFAPTEMEDLTTAEVALDSQGCLRRPDRLFLIESERLTQRFGSELTSHLVPRNEDTWRGLEAAGLRGISEAVKASIVGLVPAEDEGWIEARLRDRRPALIRFLSPIDAQARPKVERFFGEYEIQVCSRLDVQYQVDLGSTVLATTATPEAALCSRTDSVLYCLYTDGVAPAWLEIARELLRAIDVDPAAAANGVLTAERVLAAEDLAAADRILDACDIPPLDLTVFERVAGRVIDDFEREEQAGEDLDTDEPEPGFSGTGSDGSGGSSEEEPNAPGPGDDSTHEGSHQSSGHGDADDSASGGHSDAPAEGGEFDREQGDRMGAGAGPGGSASPTGETSAAGDGAGQGRGAGSETGGDSQEGRSRSKGSGAGAGSSPYRRQHRRRTYVAPVGAAGATDSDQEPLDPEVERAAVDAVLEWERKHGREPREMDAGNEGFDIKSEGPDGLTRLIEVKGTKLKWGLSGVDISAAQFRWAQREQERYWLYVVDLALTHPRVHPIQDPASKIDKFAFDDGWELEADYGEERTRTPLPLLRLPQERSGIAHAVEVRRSAPVGMDVLGWISAGHERERDWFGFLVEGDALGMARRGGIAIVDGDRSVPIEDDDDEILLVRLHDQLDPDSRTPFALGRWTVIRDESGGVRNVRLDRDGNTEPLTVHHLDHLEILGRLQRTVSLAELDERGWLTRD
jgi:hypothetical protein